MEVVMSQQKSDWQDDAITEPPNSTVDDWLGQRVERDEKRAEQALADADGDEAKAEERFEDETERREGEPLAEDTHERSNPGEPANAGQSGFGESDIPDPMPDELLDTPDQTKAVDAMEGESPTG